MVTLDYNNLFKISPAHGIEKKKLYAQKERISTFLKKIHEKNQGFYSVIDDKKEYKKIKEFALKQKEKYKDIIVLGIGGSALGTHCLKQSLKHLFEDTLIKRSFPRLHVIDNIDPSLIQELEDSIDYKSALFIVITKSGETPETLAQYFYFRNQLKKKKLKIKDHMVFVTDPKNGVLREIGEKEKMTIFDIPENVGGRFSVLTSVGLLPAALIGIDIDGLLRGAQEMRNRFLSEQFGKNIPFQLAFLQYFLYQKSHVMNVYMPYSQKLIRFVDWIRQLVAESIGKAKNIHGKTIHVGITTINALGVTDQHSQSQLYNEGPNDKLFIFIKVKNLGKTLKIPYIYDAPKLRFLKNVTFNQLMETEMEATMKSLTSNNRPNILLQIDKVDEYHLGELFMLFEAATAFLGEFLEINAFDQPGVELSKQITKKLLLKKSLKNKT